jgi:hypothetical protein
MSMWYHGWLSSPQYHQQYFGTVPEFEAVMAPPLPLMTKFALLSLAQLTRNGPHHHELTTERPPLAAASLGMPWRPNRSRAHTLIHRYHSTHAAHTHNNLALLGQAGFVCSTAMLCHLGGYARQRYPVVGCSSRWLRCFLTETSAHRCTHITLHHEQNRQPVAVGLIVLSSELCTGTRGGLASL